MNTQTANNTHEVAPETIRITGSEAIIRCLLAEGVDILYGYPGGAIMPVYDELYKFRNEIHHVLTRHE
ncbi:MAG TPA: thiamine pyrophosphate-binding protein, partial [Mariniflexile sp.]|nr:thiamine pyrophosphate-binding protein [Mariniflexile sp.]